MPATDSTQYASQENAAVSGKICNCRDRYLHALRRQYASAGTLRIVTYNIDADTNGSGGVGTPADDQSLATVLQAIGNESLAGNSQPIDVLALEEFSWVGSGSSPTLQTVVNDLNSIYGAGTYAYDQTYDPTDGNAPATAPAA